MSYRQQASAPVAVLAFGGRVIGMHAHTGQRLWEHDSGSAGASDRLWVQDGRVIAKGKRVLSCLEYTTGRLLWQVEVPSPFRGTSVTLASFAGTVILADIGQAAAFRLDDGVMLWHDEFKGYGISDVAIAAPGLVAQSDHSR